MVGDEFGEQVGVWMMLGAEGCNPRVRGGHLIQGEGGGAGCDQRARRRGGEGRDEGRLVILWGRVGEGCYPSGRGMCSNGEGDGKDVV